MFDVIKEAFWETATVIASEWLVPIIGLLVVMGMIYSILFGGSRRG